MEWTEALPTIFASASTIVAVIVTKNKAVAAVGEKVESEASKTKLRVDEKAQEVADEVVLSRNVAFDAKDADLIFRMKMIEKLEAIELHQNNQDANLRKLVKFVAEKWTEEKTIVKGNT